MTYTHDADIEAMTGAIEAVCSGCLNHVPDYAQCLSIAKAALAASPVHAELERVKAENERLEKLVYVQGHLRCAKCGFGLVKTALYVNSGRIAADNSPDVCPNDGYPLWRVTERDAADRLADSYIELREECERLKQALQSTAPSELTTLREKLRVAEEGLEQSSALLSWYETLQPLDDWHEDYGNVLWWKLPVCEPPYCGKPEDSDWPDYHTHFTPLVRNSVIHGWNDETLTKMKGGA